MPKTSNQGADFKLLDAFWRERIQRSVLPNGLTLLVKEDAFTPVASVQVWVKTGSIHEGAWLGSGISHYLEHMLFKGTERRAGREISMGVQSHGGYINAYTTFDRTVYHIDLPAEHVNVALDILADTILHSTLPSEEVTKEKDVILREIDMGRDDPDHRLSESLFETAFRSHPFRHPIIGHRDVFATLNRDDLMAYYRSRYVPNNLVVVVAGAVDSEAVSTEVNRLFGTAARQRLAPVTIPLEPIQLAARTLNRFENVEVTRCGLAWPVPGITHADVPLLDLVSTLFGGGDSSVLWREIREKLRLVHSIDAHSWTPGEAGLFYVSFTSDPEKREKAIAAVQRQIEKRSSIGFSPAEIKKALRQIIVGEINSRKTVSGQAARIGAAEVVVGDLDHTRNYFDALKSVTNSELKRVMKTYLVQGRLTTVSLNPARSKVLEIPESKGLLGSKVEFEEIRLPNGARIVFQEDRRLPNVHLRLLCVGGPLYEEPSKRGATTLLTTLLTKDTHKRSAAQVAEFIESVGGAFYPFSGNNSFGLASEVLPTDIDRALTLLNEAIYSPAFKSATVAGEREAQISELQQESDDVVSYGRKLLRKKFFGSHPFALDSAGDPDSVAKLQPADLSALWKRCFVAGNVVLAVAGDFDRKSLLPKLKALLAKMPKRAIQTPSITFDRPAEPGNFVDLQPREQAVVYQAFPGPGVRHPDFYVSEVADELFSGMSSRLFERVREEKGLAYFVRSGRITGLDTSMFLFFAGTSPNHYKEVISEIDAEIARVQSGGVEAEELLRCQVRLKAARRMGMQTNSSRAMQAGLNALYGLPVNDWQNYNSYIDAVTLQRLQDFAKTYFKRDLRTQLVVKPEAVPANSRL